MYWDSEGQKIGFKEALKFQARDPKGFAAAQTAGKAERGEARAGHPVRLNSTLAVVDGEIIHGRDHHSLAGARATVDSAGAIDKRVTATRLILTGPLAFGLRKKKDDRELFLLVEGDGFGFVEQLDPKKQKDAREFASRLNAAASRAAIPGADAASGAPTATAEPSIPDQIRQLGQLRDEGLLTPDEFEAKKSELLGRL